MPSNASRRMSTMSVISSASRASRMSNWSERIDNVMDDYVVGIAPIPIIEVVKEQSLPDHMEFTGRIPEDWKHMYMQSQIERFRYRVHEPTVDEEGLFGSDGPAMLFAMVNETVDNNSEVAEGAPEGARDREVMKIVGDCLGVMTCMQDLWVHTIDAEFKKHKEKYPSSSKSKSAVAARTLLMHYIIAIANDKLKCAEYLESLWGKVKPMVTLNKDKKTIDEWMISTIEGYINISRQCCSVLIALVLTIVKPTIKLLFQQQWYKGGVMAIITKMMEEALNPCQTFLNQTLLEVLFRDLTEAFLATYLTSLANTYYKIKIPAAIQMVKEDVRVSFQFFAELKPAEDEFDIMDMVIGMLEASPDSIVAPYWTFAKSYGPNLHFTERLLKARDDLDKAKVASIMRNLTKKVRDDRMSETSYTVMKKVMLTSKIKQFRKSPFHIFMRSKTVKF